MLHLYRFIEFTANKIKGCQTYTDLKIIQNGKDYTKELSEDTRLL